MSDSIQKDKKNKPIPFAEDLPKLPQQLQARKRQIVRDALSDSASHLFRTYGFESVTVEEIAKMAGVSRRTFFRYYKSKEDVMVERLDRDGERLVEELESRPLEETPLMAIRNSLIIAIEYGLQNPELVREATRLARETTALRRALMERRNRFEERIAAIMVKRLNTTSDDNTPMLLAFVTRALNDTVFNAWYDNETDDIVGLVDDLISRLYTIVNDIPNEFKS
jgi:AcrR family transcriptional regulator